MLWKCDNPGTRYRPATAALLAVCLLSVCLPAWSQDGAARVVSMTGRVSVLRDSTPWALDVGSVIQPQQVIVTGPDGLARLEVSDGSTFDVFPNSRVTFRATRSNWKDLLDV